MKKRLILSLWFSLLITLLIAQDHEFPIYSNGLIYSEQTMDQLEAIVDSLNLKFKSCDLEQDYFSMYQSEGTYFSFSNKKILKDLENEMPFAELKAKYPKLETTPDLLLVLSETTRENDKMLLVEAMPINYGYVDETEYSAYTFTDIKQSPFYIYKTTKKGIEGHYFPKGIRSNPLEEKYARYVQYVDCMIDTSAQIFYDEYPDIYAEPRESEKIDQFLALVNNYPGDLEYPDFDEIENNGGDLEAEYNIYREKLDAWNEKRMIWIRDTLSKIEAFQELLEGGIEDALAGATYYSDEFEFYVGQFVSKDTELDLKRRRIVYGTCSQDDSPRIHAKQIAVLSAETVKWDIFLRAHLDIMNDRFPRVTDGSYAWGRRKTYVKEIEELGIETPTLLIGVCLQSRNTHENHYSGTMGRMGRAISDSSDQSEIMDILFDAVADDKLDDYNRLLLLYVIRSCQNHTDDKSKSDQIKERLTESISKLPEYMKNQITLK